MTTAQANPARRIPGTCTGLGAVDPNDWIQAGGNLLVQLQTIPSDPWTIRDRGYAYLSDRQLADFQFNALNNFRVADYLRRSHALITQATSIPNISRELAAKINAARTAYTAALRAFDELNRRYAGLCLQAFELNRITREQLLAAVPGQWITSLSGLGAASTDTPARIETDNGTDSNTVLTGAVVFVVAVVVGIIAICTAPMWIVIAAAIAAVIGALTMLMGALTELVRAIAAAGITLPAIGGAVALAGVGILVAAAAFAFLILPAINRSRA